MKRLLVVGASGFLGQALVRSYRDNGWIVSTMGRRADDDYDLHQISNLTLSAPYDRLIHVAAVNETKIMQDLDVSYQVNVLLSRQLVELCRNNAIPQFIYMSTFHVYGRSSGVIDETTPIAPQHDYALTHYLSERIISDLASYGGYTPLILRPTNIFGVPADLASFNRWTLVPFDFVRRAVVQADIHLQNPDAQRNFVGVDDVIAATHLVGRAKVINVYGRDTMSILAFAQLVFATLGADLARITSAVRHEMVQEPALEVQSLVTDYQPQCCLIDFIKDFSSMVADND